MKELIVDSKVNSDPNNSSKFFLSLYLCVYVQAITLGFAFDCYNLGGAIVGAQLDEKNPSLMASFINDGTILGGTIACFIGGQIIKTDLGRLNSMKLGNIISIAGLLP